MKTCCFYQNYREVRLLVIHCSATRYDRDYPIEALRADHVARGFADIGNHFYITRDGMIHRCRPVNQIGAHVAGWIHYVPIKVSYYFFLYICINKIKHLNMKAILLVRVSTSAQEFDEQEKEIYEMAIKDGYLHDNIIPICEKESGIKLSEEERAGLNRMKELIESDNTINCVYCWEVSRIARRKKVNFSVLDYLISHRVQLVIKTPSIRLFKDNGEIDEGAEIIFTLFSQIAESEMRTKLARWKRTKDSNRRQSIYTGGWLLFGYEVDEATKKIVPNKDAELVQMIFNLYLTGNYSYNSLAKELVETGAIKKSLANARQFIRRTLCNTSYAGLPSSMNGYNNPKTEGNVYPAIVTMDMINRCKKIAFSNKNEPKKKYSCFYFGKGLLRCPHCGNIMVAKKNNNTYHCQCCPDGFYVQINLVDSILWYSSIALYTSKLIHSNTEDKLQYDKQLSIIEDKIATSNEKLNSMAERIEIIEYKAYVDGSLAINKAESFIDELNDNINVEKRHLSRLINDKATIQQMLIELNRKEKNVNIDEIAKIKEDEMRYNIIHEIFDCAFIDKIDKMKYTISIYPKLWNYPLKYTLDTKNNKVYTDISEDLDRYYNDKLWTEVDGEKRLPQVEEIKCYEQRFKPVRDRAKSRIYNLKYYQEHKEENARRQREYRARLKAKQHNNNSKNDSI